MFQLTILNEECEQACDCCNDGSGGGEDVVIQEYYEVALYN